MRTSDQPVLWLTLRGASPWVPLGWIAWTGTAAGLALLAVGVLGVAGPLIAVLAAGWVLARRLPAPDDCLYRYHLDAHELTVMGPARRVRRLAWNAVESIAEERDALRVVGGGVSAELPLAPLVERGALVPVLERVVPPVAAALWDTLDESLVRLVPDPAPASRGLAWWGYAPAALVCAVVGAPGLAVLGVLVAAERAVALVWARRQSITIHPAGVAFTGPGGFFAPWSHATVAAEPGGLRIGQRGHGSGLVSSRLPNFWAAAAVIQLRAQLGTDCPVRVHFRVRVESGALAVVGEIDAEAPN